MGRPEREEGRKEREGGGGPKVSEVREDKEGMRKEKRYGESGRGRRA